MSPENERPDFRCPKPAKTILVGMGNPILSDDGAGIVVARAVYAQLAHTAGVDFLESAVGGFELAETLAGYQRAIIVDAVQTDGAKPGEWRRLDLAELAVRTPTLNPHYAGLAEGVEVARRFGLSVPQRVTIYAIEAADICTFSVNLTDPVAAAVPGLVQHILAAEFRESGDPARAATQ